MIEDGLFEILSQASAVTAIVGTNPVRVYPLLAPEPPTYPFVAYSLVSETNSSAMGSDTGVLRRRMQMDCYDTTAKGARVLADAVKTALKRYRGTVNYGTGPTAGSVTIQDIFILGQTDIFDFEAKKFKRAVDLDVVFDG